MLFADHRLACRVERSEAAGKIEYLETLMQLYPEFDAGYIEIDGGVAIHDTSNPYMARVIALEMNGPISSTRFDEIELFYRERNAPVRVDLCPLGDPSLGEIVSERGYRIYGWRDVLALEPARAELPPLDGNSVEVRMIDLDEIDLFVDVILRGFIADEARRGADVPMARSYALRPGSVNYLASIDGMPAGGGTIAFGDDGIGWLSGTSTIPEHRRRGVQSALLRARLALARERGCELALVQASPGSDSHRNIERVGFRMLYSKLTMTT